MKISVRPRLSLVIYGFLWMTATGVAAFTLMRCVGAATGEAPALPAAVAAETTSELTTDPARVMGAKACVKCHKSEYARWLKTVHYRNHERLTTKAALNYAKALGIPESRITKGSVCVSCHATSQKSPGGEVTAISGVSCESCHGPAGGDPGWLNRHAVYGPEGTTREQETAQHRTARLEFCRKQGKTGPDNLYGLAKKCLGCHIVGNEKLIGASHKAGSVNFEFASWTAGEVRHNYHIDQSKNADVSSLWLNPVGEAGGKKREAANRRRIMFVLGLLVDLEVSLRNRAQAKGAAYAAQMGARIAPMQGKLAQINALASTPETKQVAALVPALLGRLFVVQEGDEKFFNAQADAVSKAAQSFLAHHDGSKLKALEGMIPKAHFSKEYKE